MNKLLAGQYCYVSDKSEEDALANKDKRYFIGYMLDGVLMCESTNSGFSEWFFAVPIPEKKLNPWTLETFPKEVVWLREKGDEHQHLVTECRYNTVKFSGSIATYEWLSKNCERIANDSILPCGVYDEN